ncbi:MAG: hypothetical protein ACTSRZ_05465 [Promethearchaeota archaeon]
MHNFNFQFANLNNNRKKCPFCGFPLNRSLLCLNSKCRSHDFKVGNRVFVISRPEYGFGFIDKISDFKTAYEFCRDEEHEKIEYKKDYEDNQIFEKPMYRVRFKIYDYKTFPKEELRHDIFEVNQRVRTIFGIGTIEKRNLLHKNGDITYDVKFEDNKLLNLKENEIIEVVYDPIESLIKDIIHGAYK